MAMSLWLIMSKIRLECFMWGAGTALGELPPYFMARAARSVLNFVMGPQRANFTLLILYVSELFFCTIKCK